jgi:two-component system chemotaxis response regulator CheB
MNRIKVLIVDDSNLIVELLTNIMAKDDQLEVIGTACDPFDAREKIKQLDPDVITLDVEMPRMDGLTFLKNVMRLRPIPVVMISTLTQKGADITLQALETGAVDFVAKPTTNVSQQMQVLADEICSKVRAAAKANVLALETNVVLNQERSLPPSIKGSLTKKIDLIVVGASTGGTEALKTVVRDLPEMMPPIVVVQHMPENFTLPFAQRVNQITRLNTEEFTENEKILQPGSLYIANGANHMKVKRLRGVIRGYVVDSPLVNRHRPAVDVLFESVAEWSDNNVIAVLLTGMGADGARGMGELYAGGAETIAQDQESSVVWGMPRVAVEQNVVSQILPLDKIGKCLVARCYQ